MSTVFMDRSRGLTHLHQVIYTSPVLFGKRASRKAAMLSFCFQSIESVASTEVPTKRPFNPCEGILTERGGEVKFERLSMPHWRKTRSGCDLAMDRRSMKRIVEALLLTGRRMVCRLEV